MDNETRLLILRKQVDEIDEQLVNILDERFAVCEEIGKIKKQTGISVYNANREEQIIKRLSDLEIHKGFVAALWPQIMEFSKLLQH